MDRRSAVLHPGFIYIKRRGRGFAPPPPALEEPPSPPGDNLWEQDREVLSLLRWGLSNREIAATLSLSPGTVRHRLSRVFRKLGVRNRTQAALWAVKNLSQQ